MKIVNIMEGKFYKVIKISFLTQKRNSVCIRKTESFVANT